MATVLPEGWHPNAYFAPMPATLAGLPGIRCEFDCAGDDAAVRQ
jgi:hypothetical protein